MDSFRTCKPATTNSMFLAESKNENQQLSVIAIIKDSRSNGSIATLIDQK